MSITGANRKPLVLSAVLLLIDFIVFMVASVFHPSGANPNDHPASFVQYAHISGWTADHLGFFVAFMIIIAGLLVLFYALNLPEGIPRLVARIGIVLAGAALALSAMRFAVDGVVLKRAVDAWVSAPDPEKAARFASAETVRWMEEAIVSYQGFTLGFTLILLAALIIWTARVPRPIGYLLGFGGVCYLAVGWIIGVAGFAPEAVIPSYVGQFIPLFVSIYLLIAAWRMPQSAKVSDYF